MKKVELLAPAGNLKKLKYAFAYGADAVYCGIPAFSLRVRINQFTLNSLRIGVEYAHNLGKKVYVTVNIFAHERHIDKLESYILKLKKLQVDALIVSDPGILTIIKKVWPKVEIHLSTQANCTNAEAVKFWAKQGISRIILAREVTLKEIQSMHKKVGKTELEYFVHGAMCMSYSGRCLLSKFFNNKSANLGDCTQPCRWNYKLVEEKRPNAPLEIEEDSHGSYIMNSKDLCLLESVPDLIKAGIVSLKIEGRAKSIYYLGNIVKVYRQTIDNYYNHKKTNYKKLLAELEKSPSHGFTTGFLFGREKCDQLIDKSHVPADWEFCGEVIGNKIIKNKNFVKIKVHNQIKLNDEVEFIVPFEKNVEYQVKQILNKDNEVLEKVHGGQDSEILLQLDHKLPLMSLMRRKIK